MEDCWRNRERNGRRAAHGRAALPVLMVLCLVLLSAGGCDKDKAARSSAPTSEPAKKLPLPETIPGLKTVGADEDNPGATEQMVKSAYDRPDKETYTHDGRFPAGTLVGGFRFVEPKKMSLPAEDPIAFTGPYAIRKPEPKELAYYKVLDLKWPHLIVRLGREKYGYTYIPFNVALRLRGIEKGRRPPLDRPVMMVRQGRLWAGDRANYGGANIQFGPMHEPAQFTTWDAHPSEIVVTRQDAGKEIFRQTIRYVQSADNKERHHTTGHLAYKPQFASTPALREAGVYVVSDARHPWMKGYLIVVDNPYAVVTTFHKYYPRCNFKMDGVPPGKHTLEVWHPFYRPVKPTMEVEIDANKVTEVLIEFAPPTSKTPGR